MELPENVYFHISIVFILDTTSILKLVFPTVYCFCLDGYVGGCVVAIIVTVVGFIYLFIYFVFLFIYYFSAASTVVLFFVVIVVITTVAFVVGVIVVFCMCGYCCC